MRTLVLGGARSGKSAHAEGLLDPDRPVRYVATARVKSIDTDWAQRIATHRERRPAHWETVENADLVALLCAPPDGTAVLVDDLGTWLTAEIDDAGAWERPRGTITPRCQKLIDAVAAYPGTLVLVTPEVGLGVVPPTASGRLFRDEIGRLNAQLAQTCDEVVLLVAGLPLNLRTTPNPTERPL